MTAINSVNAGINAYRDVAGTSRRAAGTSAGSAIGSSGDGFVDALKGAAESWVDSCARASRNRRRPSPARSTSATSSWP